MGGTRGFPPDSHFMKLLFISDLHLDPDRPDIQTCFNDFISSCVKNASEIKALYILGDLFEVWLGDDASVPYYQSTIEQLKQLNKQGIAVYVMHGNRDFLLGREFEQAAQCQLIPDPYQLQIKTRQGMETLLLSHGDILCTDDTEYMGFRKMVHNSQWQTEFLSRTIEERIAIARSMRQQSKKRGQEKPVDIMDVNQQAVEDFMLSKHCLTLIHGHTHRPNSHRFKLNNKPAQRIVLPDWNPCASPLKIDFCD